MTTSLIRLELTAHTMTNGKYTRQMYQVKMEHDTSYSYDVFGYHDYLNDNTVTIILGPVLITLLT